MTARERLDAYPDRPSAYGLIAMAVGFAGIIAGFAWLPLLWAGGILFLGGQVTQTVLRLRWRSGYLRAMVEANQEVIDAAMASIREATDDGPLAAGVS